MPYFSKFEVVFRLFPPEHNFGNALILFVSANIFISNLLSVAGDAAFVIGATVAAITTGRVEFTFYLVQREEISAVRHITVWAIPVFQ
jgi:hypothetical protein